jgi:hypothetical protein
VFEKAGRNYLFFEELVFVGGKGVISCIEFNDSGFVGEPKVVLEANYHLSYPFVFEWEGHTYMLPEARESGRIALFRAVDFPFQWELDRVLIDGVWAVDPTLVRHDHKFWLFAGGVGKHGLIDSELFLFFADSPFGPWTPHPMNPIVSDVSRARPAGQIFMHEGCLIRPGQDCSQRYGRAVVMNRIEKLSVTEYRETPMFTLEPDWQPGNLGTHTFNMSKNYQVWDGRSYISKFRVPNKAALSLAWRSCFNPLYLRRS